jgi:hypothetical protein
MRLATTAFSFTNEWLSRRYTLEQLLRRIAAEDLGPGVELIGFQAWRSYPALTSDEVLAFRRLVDDLGLEPAALGAYVDLARRVDRPMSTDEAIEFLAPQVTLARALGFPLVRLHPGIPADVLERVADHGGVTLAVEVQGGQTPVDPIVESVLDMRERTLNVALALDFSVAMDAVPAAFVEKLAEHGLQRDDIDALIARWEAGASTRELFAAVAQIDAPAAALDEARAGFVRFGHQDPQAWRPLVPAIAYAHAKFWEENDPTRTAELLDVLREGGYDGFVACEWGGNAWADAEDVDSFDAVRRHHELCHDLMSTSAAELPA